MTRLGLYGGPRGPFGSFAGKAIFVTTDVRRAVMADFPAFVATMTDVAAFDATMTDQPAFNASIFLRPVG